MPKDETAKLTADIVLFGREEDGILRFLAIRRRWDPFKDHWALPGGHVDQGEHVEAAAHRELQEETGLTVAHLEHVGVYAEPGRDPRGRYVTFAYTANIDGTPAPTAQDDAVEAEWRRVEQVLDGAGGLAFDHQRIVRDAMRVAL